MSIDYSDLQLGDLVVGEILERGTWIRGEQEIPTAIKSLFGFFIAAEKAKGVSFGPLEIEMLALDNERCPEVPEGPHTGFVVVFAEVKPMIVARKFTMDLDAVDLETLRQSTRAAHMAANPHETALTDIECDEYIDEHAPGIAEKSIQRAVNSQTMH